jgi:hypothetical protein
MTSPDSPRPGSKWVFWLPLIFGLTFGLGVLSGTIYTVDAMTVRAALAIEEREREFESAFSEVAEAVRSESAIRSEEVSVLERQIKEQWRTFYEALEARQPVLKKSGINSFEIEGK